MNQILKLGFIPNLAAIALLGIALLPVKPASADDKILRDVGIGAAAGAVSGIITNDSSVLTNAVNGAAAGAAVNGANGVRNTRANRDQNRNCLQDVGVGAAGGTVSGAVTNRRRTASNAINGAVAGGAICLLTR